MRKRARNLALFAVALIALVAGVLYEASTHVLRGWLRGEAFYDGRPTSYWRTHLERWEILPVRNKPYSWYRRKKSWSERNLPAWMVHAKSEKQILDEIGESECGPWMLHAEDSKAVLIELLNDSSPDIRSLARIGLKMKMEHSDDD